MSKRSDKMYKDSPTIGEDGEGKKVVKKKESKAAETDSGTEGMPEHESHALEMHHKHEKEHLDLNQKHEKERHALHSKHMKSAVEGPAGGEVTEHKEKHEGDKSEKKEAHAEKKTDNDKGAK